MVPSMYHQIVNHPDFLKTDLSTIVTSHSGAAHLPQEIATKFRNQTPNNLFFSDGFGMSETVGTFYIISTNRLNLKPFIRLLRRS